LALRPCPSAMLSYWAAITLGSEHGNFTFVRAKFCPHVFWILLDKTVEELTMFSSVNSCFRFLENKLSGRSSRKMDKMSKLIPWSEA